MNIHLHIERLVLDGLSLAHSQRPLLQAAVETELTRLLAADGLSVDLRTGGAVPHVHAEHFELASGTHPRRLGQQIAQAVYGGIAR